MTVCVFETVDWPRNNGACPLDTSPVGKARIPLDWAYYSGDWGNSMGFGETDSDRGGKAALLWRISGAGSLASPVVRLTPGQYVLNFWASSMGARTGGNPSPVNNVFLEWAVYGEGRQMPQGGWELGRYTGHRSPLPQGQGFEWSEFSIPFTVEREDDYRVALYLGALAGEDEEGQALLLDDLTLYRAGQGVSLTNVSTSSLTMNWTTTRPGETRVDWGTQAGLLANTATVPGIRTNHSVTISGLSANTGVFSRAYSPAGAGCDLAYESYLVPATKPSSTSILNPSFEGSVTNWQLLRTSVGPWQNFWGMTPQSGSFLVAVGGSNTRVNAGMTQRVKVTPGWRYRVTAWGNTKVQGQPAESTRCVLRVDPEGRGDPYRQELPSYSVSTQGVWQKMIVEVNATGDVLSIFGLMQQDYLAALNLAGFDNFSIIGDGTPPSTPIVTDNGPYAGHNHTLNASWVSTDSETGIEEYRFAIGTSPHDPGSGYIVGWKSVGTLTSALESGLSLSPSETYYWYVQAKNGVGLWSEVGVSNGVQLDATPPTIPVVTDTGYYTTDLSQLSASWLASDPESGIVEYQYAIASSPTDPGSGYLLDWKSAGTAEQVTETALNLQPWTTYFWYVKAQNNFGLWSAVGVSDGITVVPSPISVGQAKMLANGTSVYISDAVVTAGTGQVPGRIYIADPNRSSGIAILNTGMVAIGDVVDIIGSMGTTVDGERFIDQKQLSITSSREPQSPHSMTLRTLAGGPFFFNIATGAGQRGVTVPSGSGLNSIGQLVEVNGWVSEIDDSFIYIDDGSWPSIPGIRVSRVHVPAWVSINDFLVVRGISSMRRAGLAYQPLIRPRSSQDIQLMHEAGPLAFPLKR